MKVFIAGESEVKAVEKILNHPKVYDAVTDDLSPDVLSADFISSVYIINENRTGVVRLDPMNGICCSVHIATLPEMWGNGIEFVREVMRLGFNVTRVMSVMAIIPDHNKFVKKLCVSAGFEKQGVIKKSFLKNWKLQDQTIYSLSKYDFLQKGEICQQQ